MFVFNRGLTGQCVTTNSVLANSELLTPYLHDPLRRTNAHYMVDYSFVPKDNFNDAYVIQVG